MAGLALTMSLQEFSDFLLENVGIDGNKFTIKEARAAPPRRAAAALGQTSALHGDSCVRWTCLTPSSPS